MASGVLFQSSGLLRVMNCSFILLITVLKNVSIFYHSREKNGILDSYRKYFYLLSGE